MTKKIRDLFIWDSNEQPLHTKNLILWKIRSNKIKSIINYVDKNSINLKKKILDIFGDFNKANIDGLNIKKYYNFDDRFSYWYLSFFVEKNIYKKNFFHFIKILALIEIIKKTKINLVRINSNDEALIDFLKIFCKKKKILLKIKTNKKKKKLYFRHKIKNFGRIIAFIVNRISFRKNKILKGNIFFSYYENDINPMKKSIYWSDLLNNLKNREIVQIFVPSIKFSNIRKIKNTKFSILDYELNFNLLIKIIFFYLNITFLNKKIEKNSNKVFTIKGINYWPAIKPYWSDSFNSFNLFKNIYYYTLIKNLILKRIQNPKNFFFLYENQPWERTLNFYLKKKFSKIKTYGIAHTPIRFWDLRFFNSKKLRLINYSPNFISFVNKHSYNIFKSEFKGQKKIILEALRYRDTDIKFAKINKKAVLIIGDYLDAENFSIKSSIENSNILKSKKFIYLPHPANQKKIYQNIKYLNSKDQIIKYNISKVIVPHMSTSVVEYLIYKKDVIVFLSDNMPNMSPLFMNGNKIQYVFDTKSLIKSLNQRHIASNHKIELLKPFGISDSYIFWKKLFRDDFKK